MYKTKGGLKLNNERSKDIHKKNNYSTDVFYVFTFL